MCEIDTTRIVYGELIVVWNSAFGSDLCVCVCVFLNIKNTTADTADCAL